VRCSDALMRSRMYHCSMLKEIKVYTGAAE
jgi:hypothetical protein